MTLYLIVRLKSEYIHRKMKYAEIIENLSNSILVNFDQVYHSAEIITADDTKFPAISLKDEWIPLAPSDTKEIIYIRRKGDDEVLSDAKISSCSKSYNMRSQLRIVYFKDHAEKHNEILHKLMQSVLIGGTKLNKVIRDKYKLLKDESTGDYNFGPTAAYFAIDIYALWTLTPDNCEEDFCLTIENPLKRCLVVVPES